MAELTAEILEKRRSGLGGSDAPTVFDLGYGSRFSLWAEKVWGTTDTTTTSWQQRGHDLEPLIGTKTAERHGITDLYPGGWVDHPEHEWMFANLDYQTSDAETLVECKAVSRHKAWEWGPDEDPDGLPAHVEIQGRHQMECARARRVVVGALFIDEWELRTYELLPDPDITRMIVDGERAFWFDHVLAEQPPGVTDGPSAWDALRMMCATSDRAVDLPDDAYETVVELVTVSASRLCAEKDEKKLKAELGRLMGDAEFGLIGGDTAVEFKNVKGRNRSLKIPNYYKKRILDAE